MESLEQSLKTYEQFFEHFSGSEMVAEALYFQGEAMYELNRVDPSADMLTSAANSYKQIIDEHRRNRQESSLRLCSMPGRGRRL